MKLINLYNVGQTINSFYVERQERNVCYCKCKLCLRKRAFKLIDIISGRAKCVCRKSQELDENKAI